MNAASSQVFTLIVSRTTACGVISFSSGLGHKRRTAFAKSCQHQSAKFLFPFETLKVRIKDRDVQGHGTGSRCYCSFPSALSRRCDPLRDLGGTRGENESSAWSKEMRFPSVLKKIGRQSRVVFLSQTKNRAWNAYYTTCILFKWPMFRGEIRRSWRLFLHRSKYLGLQSVNGNLRYLENTYTRRRNKKKRKEKKKKYRRRYLLSMVCCLIRVLKLNATLCSRDLCACLMECNSFLLCLICSYLLTIFYVSMEMIKNTDNGNRNWICKL